MIVTYFVTSEGAERHPAEDLAGLVGREDGFVWLDLPGCTEEDAGLLTDELGCHPRAVQAAMERNQVPSVIAYPTMIFTIQHAPHRGSDGHVHLVELDSFVGDALLVTVHGPADPAVDPDAVLRQTRSVLGRIDSGRLTVRTPTELYHAISMAFSFHQRLFVDELALRVPVLQGRVLASDLRDSEVLLNDLFLLRQELLTVRTMAANCHAIHTRMSRYTSTGHAPLAGDLADSFDRVAGLCDAQREFIVGVIEHYQSRVSVAMTLAAERLAVLASVTLPVTAISSVYGMNVIVHDDTQVGQLIVILSVMAAIVVVLLVLTRRRGWW